MRIICTICSKHKNDSKGLLPARLRYTSPHIKAVERIAEKSKLPFFILSGKYGLISADEMIPSYDYYLEERAIDSLAKTVYEQLKKHSITELDFYTESKPSWAPYELVLRKGAELAGVALIVHSL